MRPRGRPARPQQGLIIAGIILIPLSFMIVVAVGVGLYLYTTRSSDGANETPNSNLTQPPGAAEPGLPPAAGQPTLLPVTQVGSTPAQPTSLPPATLGASPTSLSTVIPSAVDIDALLAQMTLDEKVGQMLMAGVAGQTMSAQTASLIQQYQIGSIVYFGENTQSPEQTLALSQSLQATASTVSRGIPLLIAIDHEGGTVFRFETGLTHFPNLMALGATGSPDLAFRTAAANAQELKAVGINLDLGPVLDVNDQALNPVIGVRSFGGLPDLTASLGVAYINGLQNSGVIAAAKHYPGHGSTTDDSHETLPVIRKSVEELRAHELVPFKAAVDAGVGIMMVGHIAFPLVDPSGGPSSLSPIFISDILRGEMGFTGVVMTDALSMGAIEGGYSLGEAAVQSILAGTDLLAYTGPEAAINAHSVLMAAAQSGRIPAERIDEAARRILQLKQRFGLFDAAPATGQFDRDVNAALAQEIARQAITLHGAAGSPLVSGERVMLVTPDVLPVGSTTGDGLSLLGELLSQGGRQVDEWIYPVQNASGIAAIQPQAVQALGDYPLAVVVMWDAVLYGGQWGSQAQIDLVTALQAAGKPVIVVAGSSPFDLELVSPGGVGLAMYGGLDYQVKALAEALIAATPPTGRLPVLLGER